MSVQRGFAFGHSAVDRDNAPSSGNGGDGRTTPSDPLDSRDALAGLSGTHDDHEATYRRAAAASSGIGSDQGSGGVSIGGPTVDGFTTTGHAARDDFSTVTGGSDDLVQRADNPPDTSGGVAI
jgi:hypothetical protein